METRPQTVSPRRTRDKADLGLSLQIPSPSHLAPKSLRADSYYVSENQGGHPREAHWTLPAPSAHAERGHLRDRTKETEPKSLPGDRRRDGGGGGVRPKDASMTMFRLHGSSWSRRKRSPYPCLYQESPWSRVRVSPAESRVCPRLLRKRRLRKRAQGPGASHNCPQSRPAGKHLLSCPSHLSNLIFDITPCLPGDARPLHPRSRPVPWWSSG